VGGSSGTWLALPLLVGVLRWACLCLWRCLPLLVAALSWAWEH
jgi:hypothetical protein